MATVHLSPIGNGFQFFTTTGLPLNGGLLYTYQTGSATPAATYTTLAGNVANANPIVLSADGRLASEVWLIEGTAYRFQLYTALGTLIQTLDDIYGINDLSVNAAPLPATGVTFLQAGTGAVVRTVQDKERDWVSIKDFGVKASNTGAQNDAGFQAAAATGFSLFVPEGIFDFQTAIPLLDNQAVFGVNPRKSVLRQTVAANHGITTTSKTFVDIKDIRLTNTSGASTGTGIRLDGGGIVTVRNVEVDLFSIGVQVRSISPMTISDLFTHGNVSHGLHIMSAGVVGVDVYLNNVTSQLNGGDGVRFEGLLRGMYGNGIYSLTNTGTGCQFISNADGFPAFGQMEKLYCDNSGVNGMLVDGGTTGVEFLSGWWSNRGSGSNCKVATATDIRFVGGKVYSCYRHGIELGGNNCMITGLSVEDAGTNTANTYDGITVGGADNVITGVRVTSPSNKTRWGISVLPTATFTTITGGDVGGCVTGGFVDASAGPTRVVNVQGTTMEGNWTPIDSSGAALSFAAGTTGRYTRIGRMVYAYARVVYPVTANGANAIIGGLPFTVANSEACRQGDISYTTSANAGFCATTPNATTADIFTAAGVATTNVQMSNTQIYVLFTYEAAAP